MSLWGLIPMFFFFGRGKDDIGKGKKERAKLYTHNLKEELKS